MNVLHEEDYNRFKSAMSKLTDKSERNGFLRGGRFPFLTTPLLYQGYPSRKFSKKTNSFRTSILFVFLLGTFLSYNILKCLDVFYTLQNNFGMIWFFSKICLKGTSGKFRRKMKIPETNGIILFLTQFLELIQNMTLSKVMHEWYGLKIIEYGFRKHINELLRVILE